MNRYLKSPKFRVLTAAAVLLIAGSALAWTYYHKGSSDGIPTIRTVSGSQSGEAADSNKDVPGDQPGNNTTGSVKQPDLSSQKLEAPFGTFVSNHHPSLSADESRRREQSTCNTTPGANCYIQFTKNGETKKLESLVVNKDGYAIWTWDVKDAGLTEGDWKITAVASLNGQSLSASDSLPLSVGP